MASRPYGEPVEIAAGTSYPMGVSPGDRLTVYTSAAVTLAWARDVSDALAQTWHTGTGPERLWPVDVPAGVHILQITTGGQATLVRLVHSH